MFHDLNEGCLDEWLSDYEAFKDAFLRYCYFLSKAIGYYPQVDFKALKLIHENWKNRCQIWADQYIMKDSDGLSHLKILSILLSQIALNEWVAELEEFDPEGLHEEGEYNGTPEEHEESKQDLNAGRGTFLGYQFVADLLNSYEESRDDKIQPFVYRMTADLEHDLMVFLLWERGRGQDLFLFEISTFLFFKALFVRDSKD
jgi:hypothetical protein